MKKIFYLFMCAVVSMTATVFTSCSDDEEPAPEVTIPIEEELAGTYSGDLEINLAGAPLPGVEGQEITVTKASDTSIDFSLKNFSFMNMTIGDIELKGCELTESGDKYAFTGTTTLENNTLMITAEVEAEGTIGGGNVEINMDINASLMGQAQAVTVVYKGTKK